MFKDAINRGSYMSVYALLSLLTEGKEIKCNACRALYHFSASVK